MELYQLKSFLEIAKTQSLTKAALNLHLSQSALSNQIKLLEEEFELLLFLRTPKGMMLTEQGRVLQSYAVETVDNAASLLTKARELAGKVSGTFKIGLNTDGSFLKISRLTRRLTDTFPDVNFIIVSSATIRTAEMLRGGHIDLGFFFGEQRAPDLLSEQIAQVKIRIVIPEKIFPQKKKISWDVLADLPWIWSVCDCPYYQIVQSEFDKYNKEPKRVIDAMDESVVKALVVDGQGIAILRQDEADEVLAKGDLYVWEDMAFDVPLSISFLKEKVQDPTVNAVATVIKNLWANNSEK